MKLKHFLTVFPGSAASFKNESEKPIYLYINDDATLPDIGALGSVDICDRSLDLRSYEGESE